MPGEGKRTQKKEMERIHKRGGRPQQRKVRGSKKYDDRSRKESYRGDNMHMVARQWGRRWLDA